MSQKVTDHGLEVLRKAADKINESNVEYVVRTAASLKDHSSGVDVIVSENGELHVKLPLKDFAKIANDLGLIIDELKMVNTHLNIITEFEE